MEKEQELLERQSPEEEAAPIEEAPPPEAAPVEETPAQKLAACILATTREAHVTPLKKLKLHLPEGVTPEEAEEQEGGIMNGIGSPILPSGEIQVPGGEETPNDPDGTGDGDDSR